MVPEFEFPMKLSGAMDSTGQMTLLDKKASAEEQRSITLLNESELCSSTQILAVLPPEQWRMLGLPCEVPLQATVQSLWGDTFGTLNIDWAVFTFNAQSGLYEEAEEDTQLVPGQGFWLQRTNEGSVALTLPAQSQRTLSRVDVLLCDACVEAVTQGQNVPTPWRMLGNPQDVAMPVENMRIRASMGLCDEPAGCSFTDATDAERANLAIPAFYLCRDWARCCVYND